MVLKETSKEYPDELMPSFDDSNANIVTSDTNRSEEITKVLIEYESEIVPKMLELGFMKKIAKSRSKPYYNKSDQTMTAHILPGVEIMADVIEKSNSIDESEFRQLVSLWTIHDLHKIINNSKEEEFEIDKNTVDSWVTKLKLDNFVNDKLTSNDFYSCVVGLHNSDTSNIDESTTKFMHLRPYLRLVDAIMSISDPDEFLSGGEKPVNAVFGNYDEVYIPAVHSVTIDDSIIRTILNKSILEELSKFGLKPIDLRDNSVLYARSVNDEYPEMDTILTNVIDNFIMNIRDGYSIFRNPAFLGGDINTGESHLGDWYMPTVYDITNLSKLCLNNTELIQRIVQAAVEQQNRSWSMSDNSREKIDKINEELGIKIPKSPFIEGMAALVHTVYRDILPELIDESSNNAYERTLESAIIHVFGVSEDVQKQIANSIKENKLNASVRGWPYKYLIANDLFKKYTRKYSDKERQKILIKLISSRLSDFTNWSEYGNKNENKIKRELYLMFATNIKIDGKLLSSYSSVNVEYYISKRGEYEVGYISNNPTEQHSDAPDLLSYRDIDVLKVPFVTEDKNGEFSLLKLDDVVPKKPLSVLSQISLNIRAQQFKDYENVKNENSLYVTMHPVNSTSVASYMRFNEILQYLKTEMFTNENNSIGLKNISEKYKEIIEDSISQQTGVNSLVNREKAFNVGTHMDEASCKLALPDDSETTIVKGAICATIASIMSGVRVCITKYPQLHMNHPDKKDLVIYGPELSMFENIINKKTDVSTLPQQLEIIERLLKLDNKITNPNKTIEQYSNLYNTYDTVYLPGSMVFSRISPLFESEEEYISGVRDVMNIDSISSQNNKQAKQLLQITTSLGRELSNVIQPFSYKQANNIMIRLYDMLYTIESINSTDELVNDILTLMYEIDEIQIDMKDVQKNGCAYKFAKEFASTYQNMGKDEFHEYREFIINGSVVRSIMYNNRGK